MAAKANQGLSPWVDRLAVLMTSHVTVALALGAAITALALSEGGALMVRRLAVERDAALEARLVANKVRRLLLVVESSQRGYLLTGRPAYREPYDFNLREAEAAMKEAQTIAARYPQQEASLTELAELAARKLSETYEVLRVFESGDRSGAVELMLTDIGREQMVRIGEIVNEVWDEESHSFDRAGRAQDAVLLWSRVGIAVMVLFALSALYLATRLGRQAERERARHLAQLAAERDQLEIEVGRRTAELTDLARHLQTVREDERGFLARELHDELGGLLTAAKLDVARLKKRLDTRQPEVADRIVHLGQTLDAGIALKRRIIEDLRPSSLANLGLKRTLEILCEEFAQRAELAVKADIDDVTLDPTRALAVYRLVQEALTNVSKYAKARQVQVALHRTGDSARITVHDDGIGFEPGGRPVGSGHGLAGMRFRVRSCGGELQVRSRPGAGTTIEATVPV